MFVNKHFIISGAYVSKGKRCSNVKPLSSVFRSYLGQRNLGIKKYLFYTIFLPIKKFYIFSIFRLNFLSYIPPFLAQFSFVCYTIFWPIKNSYFPPFFGSIFVLIFRHFSAQFLFLYSTIFWLNFRSYILPLSDSILILIFPHFSPLFTNFSHQKNDTP